MRPGDHLRFALTSLWKRRLRTFLTASGVMIGIGALVSMVSFGRGMQKERDRKLPVARALQHPDGAAWKPARARASRPG